MTITTRQQSAKKSNSNLNMTNHPPPTPGLLLSSQDDDTNHGNNYIQQLPLPPTPFNMHHELQSSSQPLINLSTNATTNTSSSAIIWDYLMAQVKVQLRTMPRDESFFSRGLELQSLVRSEVGICSSQEDLLNGGMEPMTALQSQAAAASLGSRGYKQQQQQQQQQQHQQPLSYAVSSTSFVSISPMRTFKQSRGSMYTTSQPYQLLPSTENGGIGMTKQHVYHHASSKEDTPTTSNKMNRTTSSHNQDNTPTLYCQCHPSCREVSNQYDTKLYLQDSTGETGVSFTPLAVKKMSGTYATNPTIQEQLTFSASKKDTNTGTTNTSSTSPPGQLYLHAAGLSSATSTPLHDKFVFSDMTEIDSTSTGNSPSKQKARSTTKVASKWSEVPFKAKKKKTKVKSSSRTVKKVSSAAKKIDPKPKPPKKRATRGSKKASIDSPTDLDVLCGRGGMTTIHKGNVRFRDYVTQMRSVYQQARKVDKKTLSEVSALYVHLKPVLMN